MKKVILTLALAAFAFGANAQFILGGSLGFNHSGSHQKDYLWGSASTSMTLAPKVGYQLNDNMQVGAQVAWYYTYNRNYAGANDTYTSNPVNEIRIAPYFRYNFASWKSFTVFCEAQVSIGLGLESQTHSFVGGNEVTGSPVKNADNYTSFGARVAPGLNYSLSDKLSLDLYIDLLGINWYSSTDAADNNAHGWGLEANMNAQTLFSHLSNFRIGFNYHL